MVFNNEWSGVVLTNVAGQFILPTQDITHSYWKSGVVPKQQWSEVIFWLFFNLFILFYSYFILSE